jgi:hypothetical protein
MTATTLAPERASNAARPREDQLSLADALDRILHRGVSLQGNLTIGLADVDSLFLDLRLLLGSVDAIWPDGPPPVLPVRPRTISLPPTPSPAPAPPPLAPFDHEPIIAARSPAPLEENTQPVVRSPPVDAGRSPSERGSSTAQGLIRLVLTLVKLLHDVLERQAVRRMEAGRLTDEQIENLAAALSAQAEEILKLQRQFGFSEKDLSLALDVPDGAY